MGGRTRLLCAFVCLGVAWAADSKDKSIAGKKPQSLVKSAQIDLSAAPEKKPLLDYARIPLSFEPNEGQSDLRSRFTARSHGYTLQLDPTGARFQFPEKGKKPSTLRMDLEDANRQAAITGESPLPGKANYFPSGDPKTWVTNVPTYSRVRYSGVYPGVDVSFYGTANRLEYDFLIDPGADAKQIRMKLSGSQYPSINAVGDLVVNEGKGAVHFLKPLVYQLASDGTTRESVDGRYDLERGANGEALVTFALGKYDHSRRLVIDPVVDALSYSQYLTDYYVGRVAVDSSGNSYITGSAYPSVNNSGTGDYYYGFFVTKFNPTGTVLYNSSYGTANSDYFSPNALAIDGSGNAYVTGYLVGANSGATVPTTTSALQASAGTASYESFLAVIPSSGSAPTYCTYLSGSDSDLSSAQGVAVDSSGKVYVAGYTSSVTFPTTAGVYQQTLATHSYYTGFVSKFDPTKSGAASLVYSTFLGSTSDSGNSYLSGIAVDSSGDAYVAAGGPATYPVTSGAFQYTGYDSTSGGAYVTELNPTGTALVYSAYLGYGTAYGIAVDGASAAYVTGTVAYADFPTTAGAYQTDFASGFAVKLNSGGATEAYSTFLSGPSGYNYTAVDPYPTISLQKGCASSCNAYIAGHTKSTDFPAVNAIQSAPGSANYSAFIVELNATGTSALFSSYLSGNNTYVYQANDSRDFGNTPAIAVDSSGNIYVAGNTNVLNTTPSNDFPVTIPDASTSYAFLTKISTTASAGFTVVQPTTVAFGNQTVGVSTSVDGGTATARLSNFSSTNVTLGTITVSPSSTFSASVTAGSPGSNTDCSINIVPAGGYCILDLNFTPTAAGARAGTVSIPSNASNSPATLALTGTGVDQAFGQASQSSLTFSAVVGTPSAAQSVVITNLGDVTEPLTSSGYPYLSQGVNFTQINNCPTYLLPGASCTVNVTFAPTQPGLLTDTLQFYNPGSGWTYISLTGTASVAGASTGLTLSLPSIQFGPQTQYTTSSPQYLYVTNSGTIPVVIQSYTASNLSFQVSNYNCGTVPFQINPGSSCYVEVQFTPQSAGNLTGNLAIVEDGTTVNVPLSGTGVASTQNVEFYPSSAVSFPDTPVTTTSGAQLIYFYNTGSASLTLDRVVVSGNFSIYNTSCEGTTISGVVPAGLGTGGYCSVNVQFTPASVAQGLTGALTFYYNAPGSSTVTQAIVTLTGNGIAASGTIALNPYSLNFGSQPQGVTSATQNIYLQNPGNTPVTVNSFTFTGTDAGDYSVSSFNCGSLPYTIAAGQNYCYVSVQFTPGGTGTRGPATLTVASTAGNQTASLTGIGVAATQTIGLTPTSMNLGSIVVGASGANELVYLRNTGTQAVTFSASPTITGTNAADFSMTPYYCYVSSGSTLAAGSSCYIFVSFAPSSAAAESATLTFTDSAGTQTLALSGTGVSTKPTITLSDYLVSFGTQVQGTTSPISGNALVYLYNNAATSLTLGNVSITGPFLLPNGYNSCNGQTIAANGGSCYVYVQFAPASAGYLTGTLTFNNSGGTALAGVPSVPLAGFSVAQTFTANLSPTSVNFTAQQVIGTKSSSQTITLYNTGNTSLTVGTLTGTDFGLAGSTAEFSTYPANGGEDYCSGQVVAAGSSCYIYLTFTPNAAGARTGTVSFPVTYTNSTTATLTANLSGSGVAEKDSAVLTPPNVSFVDQAVGVVTNYSIPVYLNNSGNQPFTVGSLTTAGTNASDFSTASSNGGYDGCSGTAVAAASSCYIRVTFTPGAAGARSGTITFPVHYADSVTANLVLNLAGNGVTGTKTLQITPGSLQFPAEIQQKTSTNQSVGVSNTGNLAVAIGTDTITGTNAAEFIIASDNCTGTNLAANSGSCSIYVNFKPSASATGTQTATLNIGDNATGGPHAIALSGTAIAASQQIAVSQTTLAFGNQPAGSTSSTQVVYFTNQADSAVSINNVVLGGTNAADFTIVNNNCLNQGQIAARGSCYVSANFAPPTGASNGAVTATITETDSATPGTHAITLTGTVVTAGPAIAMSPSTLTFPTQNVASTSAAQSFSVTNTGTANLTITAVASTNATEFPVSNDGCSGSVLTPGQQCLISVKFSPSLGGARTGTIRVTDNATGSPQSVAVSGTGYGIPSTLLTPTSLTFGGTNIGATSATQTITLKNTGTDTLAIGGVTLTGVNSGDFAQTNTCPASLAPVATCVITVSFKPTAGGTRSGYVSITDNANNLAGSVQTAPLTGTGVAVPTAGVSPTGLTFPSTNIGVTSTAQPVTITNSGTGSLTITSIAISGTNSGDYAETNTCGATLVAPPTSSCTISVTFKPTASGTRTATITITDNASPTTQTVSLTGTGVGLPAAALNTPNLTFSNQNVNSTSAAQMVTLSNSGTGALTISSIAFTGANPGDFAQTNTCGTSVAAGANCTISVTFTPAASGSRAATLTVTDNAGNVAGSTQTAGVSGIGGGVPTAGVSTTTLTFASTTIGGSTAAQMVTLSNSGTGPLTISSIVIGGTNPGDFAETTTCGSTLAVSSNCSISVTFTPTSAGARTANLHIVDNSGNVGSTQTVTLNGTGMTSSAAPSPVSVTPSSGTGTTQTFAAVYSDVNGFTDLTIIRILFNTAVNSAHACYISYYPGTNVMYLENDGGTAVSAGVTPGSAAQVSNSQCTLMGTGSSFSGSGNTATLNVALMFSSSALKNIYLFATSKNGASSAWVQEGTWGTTQGPPTVVSLAPTSGTGTAQTFTAVYGDPNGVYDLATARMLINTTSASGTNACYVFYYPDSNLLYLENDGGTGLSAGVTPGSSNQVFNSQCTLLGSGSSTSVSGNNLTVNTALTFSSTFLGQKNVYLLASSSLGPSTGWAQEGTWTPATLGAPSVVSLTPSSGAGATQTFAGVYSDPNGTADLATVRMLFNTAVNAASACYVLYYPGSNLLYLENDGGNGLSAGVTPGSASQVSNSQCTLTGTGSSISVSGNNVTLNLALAFSGTFVGSKNVYLYASESNATTSGWVQKGTWTP